MTGALVSRLRPHVYTASRIASGAWVRGQDWQDIASIINCLRGHGQVIVPTAFCGDQISAGTNKTIRLKVRPGIFSHRRRWAFHLRGVTTPGTATIEIPAGGTSHNVPFAQARVHAANPVWVYEDVTSPTAALSELTAKITAPAGTAVEVTDVHVEEVGRTSLLCDGTELGVDLGTLLAGQPIEGDLTAGSIGAVIKALFDTTYGAANNARRAGLHSWMSLAGQAFNTTSYVNVYTASAEAPFLAQRLRSSDASSTKRTISWQVYGQTSDVSTTASVQATTSHSGSTSTISGITNTLQWWPNNPATIDVDREDLTTTDGLQAATVDRLNWGGKRTAGAGTLTIYFACFWTEPV